MTDIGEERSLGPVDFRQGFRPLAFIRKRARDCYCGRDMARSRFVEISVLLVQL